MPNLVRLAELGISTAALSETLRVATIGDIDANLAKFTVGDRQIPIRVQLNQKAKDDLSVVSTLPVPTPGGATVPLSSVAEIRFGQGPSSINRFNRERRIVIGADMAPGAELSEGLAIVWSLPEVKNMPAGTRIQETGDAEIMGEVFEGFATAMTTGLMLVLVVLILLFGSVFHSFTILGSLPLAIGGVVAALWLTNSAISMPVVIGILMLMGIVTKNAIMLVDFAVEELKRGVPRKEAIIDAGRKRARPIVMTTIAMSAGMIPAALGVGDGGEFRAPMAIAVIGGLLVSTLLSLVFVPSFYTIMDDAAIWTARLFRWAVRPNAADEHGDAQHVRRGASARPGAACPAPPGGDLSCRGRVGPDCVSQSAAGARIGGAGILRNSIAKRRASRIIAPRTAAGEKRCRARQPDRVGIFRRKPTATVPLSGTRLRTRHRPFPPSRRSARPERFRRPWDASSVP